MGFIIKSIKELEELSNEELMEYMVKSEESVEVSFDTEYVDVSKHINRLRTKKKLSFDEVSHLLKYDNDNGNYTFIYYDEREEPIYKDYMNGGYKVPSKGFWWVIISKVIPKQLGIVVVEITIGKMVRNENDWRWMKDDKPEHQEEKLFYYDYDNKKYVQVFMDTDKSKKKKKKNENDEPSERELYIEEYKKRLEVIDYVDERMAEMEEEYCIELNSTAKEVKDLFSNHTSHNFELLFSSFLNYKFNYFDRYFSIKLSFNHVDLTEYLKTIEFMDELELTIEKARFRNQDMQIKYNNSNIPYTDSPYKENDELYNFHRYLKAAANEIQKMLYPRVIKPFNPKKNKDISLDGYYRYTLKKLYPSLGTIELRRSMTDLPMKTTDWEKQEKQILKSLNKNTKQNKTSEDVSANEVVEVKEVFVSLARELFKELELESYYNEFLERAKRDREKAKEKGEVEVKKVMTNLKNEFMKVLSSAKVPANEKAKYIASFLDDVKQNTL